MSGLCISAGLIVATLPLQAFTLAWTHSIERIRWEEDYQIVDSRPCRLVLAEARIRGSGAGMEPPDGAILKDSVWHYRPILKPLGELRLSHSPYTAGYEICSDGHCKRLTDILPGIAETQTVVIAPCSP